MKPEPAAEYDIFCWDLDTASTVDGRRMGTDQLRKGKCHIRAKAGSACHIDVTQG